MGTTCCKSFEESDSREKYVRFREDNDDYDSTDITCDLPHQVQISVQCLENPEGENGFVIYDMEAFPDANFLLPSKAKDHTKDEG